MRLRGAALLLLPGVLFFSPRAVAAAGGSVVVWWEAEDFLESNFPARHAFEPENEQQAAKLSGGRWIGVHGEHGETLTAAYAVRVPEAGRYSFWCRKFWRHGPFRWRFDRDPWTECGRDRFLTDSVSLRQHVGADWVALGPVDLRAGRHRLVIELTERDGPACFDCFVLARGLFVPRGATRPGEKLGTAPAGWFPFEPDADSFTAAAVDLRNLNHAYAGAHGFLRAAGDDFVFADGREPERFWAVNASFGMDDPASVDYLARRLAKVGVNMVRVHAPFWDRQANDLATLNDRDLERLFYFVAAMAREGIYTKLSFFFPLWFEARDRYGLPGYDAAKSRHPLALLYFHPRMQELHRAWARGLLTARNPHTGRTLADDPALAIVEIVNEDNLFFWTFDPYRVIPGECMVVLEQEFGAWAKRTHGSLEQAAKSWGGQSARGDDFRKGRAGLLSAWHLTSDAHPERSARARDQARFLAELQREFFSATARFLRRELGVKCLISASNWKTADDRLTGPLDKWSYQACDLIDRHAYFGGDAEGDGASYSVRAGHSYRDRTALFDPFSQPARELQYAGYPHIVSEYGYPMPNRFRAEAPVLAALYGALAGTDAFFHFALASAEWEQEHSKFSIYTPVVLGQFPATALLYRRGDVEAGPVVFRQDLNLADLFDLRGTPLPQPLDLDALRAADVPGEAGLSAAVDPLAYCVGRVVASVTDGPTAATITDLGSFIDRERGVVMSATGQLAWNFRDGCVTVNAPRAQGVVGFLGAAGEIALRDVTFVSSLEYGAFLAVSLDGAPLTASSRILLQVMSEDSTVGFETRGEDPRTIVNTGSPPIIVRDIAGTVRFHSARSARVVALDCNLRPRRTLTGSAGRIELLPDCLHYLVTTD